MMAPLRRWAGVDVGAAKGFDTAVIAGDRLVGGPARTVGARETVMWLREQGPRVVAVDAPRSAAADGELSRPVPRRMSQDARDAIGAAVTARLHDEGRTESFGDIVIPIGHGSALTV